MGESVHGAAEELTLKHRALRVLVEQLGFRSVAGEEGWTMGIRVDDGGTAAQWFDLVVHVDEGDAGGIAGTRQSTVMLSICRTGTVVLPPICVS